MKELKVGEWYLYGTDIVQVKTKDKYGYSLSTGFIETGTRGEEVYPLTLQNKAVAESVSFSHDEMRKLCKSINWPDIAGWTQQALYEAAGNEDKQKAVMEATHAMLEKLRELERMEFANGIRVFRR
jgi:hypothetical protein